MAPMQRLGTRVAMLAAVGIMLAGCSGGGGTTPATGGGMEQPGNGNAGGGGMTPAPSANDRSEFFPLDADKHLILSAGGRGEGGAGIFQWEADLIDGSPLENIIDENWTDRNFQQFSAFEFGSPTNANGIPLQKATKTQAGLYSAAAYQAVLEHSMFIFQGGLYNYAVNGDTAGRRGALALLVGSSTTGSPIAGTWKGKAVAEEVTAGGLVPTGTIAQVPADDGIVQGDVEIGVALNGGSQNVSIEFDNWTGGNNNYPAITSQIFTPEPVQQLRDGQFLIKQVRPSASSTWTGGAVAIGFFGPERAEAGGTFSFTYRDRMQLIGAYGAKKQ